jgi:hypothetical protein
MEKPEKKRDHKDFHLLRLSSDSHHWRVGFGEWINHSTGKMTALFFCKRLKKNNRGYEVGVFVRNYLNRRPNFAFLFFIKTPTKWSVGWLSNPSA